eukprot:scaffold256594_cov39-Prasinocladus_malaysianus.AAC.1
MQHGVVLASLLENSVGYHLAIVASHLRAPQKSAPAANCKGMGWLCDVDMLIGLPHGRGALAIWLCCVDCWNCLLLHSSI